MEDDLSDGVHLSPQNLIGLIWDQPGQVCQFSTFHLLLSKEEALLMSTLEIKSITSDRVKTQV